MGFAMNAIVDLTLLWYVLTKVLYLSRRDYDANNYYK